MTRPVVMSSCDSLFQGDEKKFLITFFKGQSRKCPPDQAAPFITSYD